MSLAADLNNSKDTHNKKVLSSVWIKLYYRSRNLGRNYVENIKRWRGIEKEVRIRGPGVS